MRSKTEKILIVFLILLALLVIAVTVMFFLTSKKVTSPKESMPIQQESLPTRSNDGNETKEMVKEQEIRETLESLGAEKTQETEENLQAQPKERVEVQEKLDELQSPNPVPTLSEEEIRKKLEDLR